MKKGIILDMPVEIAGLALIIFVIAVAFLFVYPLIRYGACWGPLESKTTEITKKLSLGLEKSIKEEFLVGDCLGNFLFINPEKLREVQRNLDVDFNCVTSTGKSSFILAIPYAGVDFEIFSPSSWIPAARDAIKDTVNEKVFGRKPICKGLDRTLTSNKELNLGELIVDGRSDQKVCVEIVNTGNYDVTTKIIPKVEKC